MCSTMGWAQQEYSFTHFSEVRSFFNPATTGTNGTREASALFRKQWFGFHGSPMNGGLSYEQPFKSYNMGIGGYLYSDQIGEMNVTNLVANYRYTLKLNEKQNLSFGMNFGADFISVNYDALVYWDEQDEMFNSGRANTVVPRAGVGVNYYAEDFYVGISVPRVLTYNDKHNVSIDKSKLPSLVSHYYLTGGYKFPLNNEFSMKTAALVKFTPNVKPQADINVTTMYQNIIGLGIGYKSLGFASVNLLYVYDEAVSFGYAFDMTLTRMANYSKGSHEIMVKYNLPMKKENIARSKIM